MAVQLRAFLCTEIHWKNPDLFSCFLGVELRAVLDPAVDNPRPVGETDIFIVGITAYDIGQRIVEVLSHGMESKAGGSGVMEIVHGRLYYVLGLSP